MSGAEAVGIVLGAIPPLISGLEHCVDGIHTMKNMWGCDAIITHLVGEFRLAQGIFQHSCQGLLMHVFLNSKAAKLLDGASPNRDDPELDQKLRARLGSDYHAYIHAVSDLRRQLTLFTRKLGLDEKTILVCHKRQCCNRSLLMLRYSHRVFPMLKWTKEFTMDSFAVHGGV